MRCGSSGDSLVHGPLRPCLDPWADLDFSTCRRSPRAEALGSRISNGRSMLRRRDLSAKTEGGVMGRAAKTLPRKAGAAFSHSDENEPHVPDSRGVESNAPELGARDRRCRPRSFQPHPCPSRDSPAPGAWRCRPLPASPAFAARPTKRARAPARSCPPLGRFTSRGSTTASSTWLRRRSRRGCRSGRSRPGRRCTSCASRRASAAAAAPREWTITRFPMQSRSLGATLPGRSEDEAGVK